MNKREKDLAICQMNVLQTVFSGGGMDINSAVNELALNNKKCLRLAEQEGFYWIANIIKNYLD